MHGPELSYILCMVQNYRAVTYYRLNTREHTRTHTHLCALSPRYAALTLIHTNCSSSIIQTCLGPHPPSSQLKAAKLATLTTEPTHT
jgi:hypothetical protein